MRHNEVDRFLETNPEVVQAFTDAFIARWDTYPYQLPDGSYTRAYAGQGETKTYLPLTTAKPTVLRTPSATTSFVFPFTSIR